MKTIQFIIILFLCNIGMSQNECPNNLITNPGFEDASSIPGYTNRFNMNSGWKRMYSPGISIVGSHTAEFYLYNGGLGGGSPYTIFPADGYMCELWITNINRSDYTFRGGVVNQLTIPLQPNSGQYTFSFDRACTGNCDPTIGPNNDGYRGDGPIEIAIYGINNPGNLVPNSPSSQFNPSTQDLYGINNTIFMGKIDITEENCDNEMQRVSMIYNSNQFNNEITHIILTNSENQLNAMRFMAIDNVALCRSSENVDKCCKGCEELQIENLKLTNQLNRCCKSNPKCCSKPSSSRPKPSILTPANPSSTVVEGDKCCKCFKELEKENEELRNRIKKCCRSKPVPGTLIPNRKKGNK